MYSYLRTAAMCVVVGLVMCQSQTRQECSNNANCGEGKCCYKYNTGILHKRSYGVDASLCLNYVGENEDCFGAYACGCASGLSCMYRRDGQSTWKPNSAFYDEKEKRDYIPRPEGVVFKCQNSVTVNNGN